MIAKEKFVEYANVLCNYFNWYNKLYDMGVNLESSELEALSDALYAIILDGDMDYDYDDYAGVSWVANWCGSSPEQTGFRRVRDWVFIEDASALYDFVTQMRELGWPEETPKEWLK